MEFLRFGSSIPGSYWGCCAVCIIQNFKKDPDAPASIEVVCGDSGTPITKDGKTQFLGKTWREVFMSRLRIGTFNNNDMPNHVFLAVLTEEQVWGGIGAKWLKILKETGFEFIRTTDNSVYTGSKLASEPNPYETSSHKNYLFGLFRNIGQGKVDDPFAPPKAWTDLGPELNSDEEHERIWNEIGPVTFYSEEELVEAKVPVTMAGRRSLLPQQLKAERDEALAKSPEATNAEDFDPFDSDDEDDYED